MYIPLTQSRSFGQLMAVPMTGMDPILWFGFAPRAPLGGYPQSPDLQCTLCTMHDILHATPLYDG